jgi:hypothetical protein
VIPLTKASECKCDNAAAIHTLARHRALN